jgi:tripartite ATP-independent transporter DctP family solute receptor
MVIGGGRGRSIVAGIVFACVTCACDGQTDAGPIELKFGHVGAPGSLYDVVTAEFARRVSERLPGEVEIAVYGSSQLGGDELLLQKLKLGTVDISLPSTVMSSTIDAFGLFEMPYLVRDREHMRRIEAEVFWPELAPLAESEGYTVLAVWENGFRHVTNSRRPIRTPGDLDGIKLRTPRGVWRVKLFQGFGANPTPMPFSEVFIALQTGVMDGQENPLAQIYSAKLHEVQDYLSLTGHVYTPAYVTMATGRWNRLPLHVREALGEIAREMQPFVYDAAARMDVAILDSLRVAGIGVNEVDTEAFVAAIGPVYEEFGAEVPNGADLIRRSNALLPETPGPNQPDGS